VKKFLSFLSAERIIWPKKTGANASKNLFMCQNPERFVGEGAKILFAFGREVPSLRYCECGKNSITKTAVKMFSNAP